MALLSLFFMSQKQSSTPLNCIIHIRNLIKFSHLKIISNKLTTAINSLSSLGSICFILVHARGLCYKKKKKQGRACVFNKREFQSLKEKACTSKCSHIKDDLTFFIARFSDLWSFCQKYPLLAFVNKILLKHSHAQLFTCSLWPISCYNCGAEQLQQRTSGLKILKHLLSEILQ